ncbi:hypothetical protein [Paludisphaera mucosa]|uniref:Uncharacterized protein n=1 Tax=Paludisphaera mucosa TaxID=3030827 RepID=A0ABT6FGE4_9BACT|nr:hypothetical protein [Paludisphaera mucosa]MDG3006653.1 hypothetical protein [Paludisphaera mucosa]
MLRFRDAIWALCLVGSTPLAALAQVATPVARWDVDSEVRVERAITDAGLGAAQGVVVRDGKVYAYGDLVLDVPRVGVIREYEQDLRPTGRVVRLTRAGQPLIIHPTGLTWREKWGTFLGDTVASKAKIVRFDWERAWRDGDLDDAVLDVVDDDVAVNGCRPTFVELAGATLLATADYGEIRPEIRLYDPAALLAAHRSSAPGVVVHRILAGPFNQNLHWDAEGGRLICVQNVVAGLGWRLDAIDLAKAVADGRVDGPDVRVRRDTPAGLDELEGFWPLGADRALFAVARRADNLVIGTVRKPPVATPAPGLTGVR